MVTKFFEFDKSEIFFNTLDFLYFNNCCNHGLCSFKLKLITTEFPLLFVPAAKLQY